MPPVKISNISAFGLWRHFSPVFSIYGSPACEKAGGETFFERGGFKDLKDFKVLKVVKDDFFRWGVAEVCHCVSRDTVYVNSDMAACPF